MKSTTHKKLAKLFLLICSFISIPLAISTFFIAAEGHQYLFHFVGFAFLALIFFGLYLWQENKAEEQKRKELIEKAQKILPPGPMLPWQEVKLDRLQKS